MHKNLIQIYSYYTTNDIDIEGFVMIVKCSFSFRSLHCHNNSCHYSNFIIIPTGKKYILANL